MATWYVRPDTTHNGTRNGTSYATAWGGWSEIVWGGGGVAGGDTLEVHGAHAYGSAINVGAHGAASEATRVTIKGMDGASVAFSGASYLGNGRSWTTIRDLTISAGTSNCIYHFGTNNQGSSYIQNALSAVSTAAAILSMDALTGQNHSDVTIDGNSFTGTAGAGIQWLCSAASAVSTLTRVTITNNTFSQLTTTNGPINLRAENDTSTSSIITDLTIDGNTFHDVDRQAIRVGSDFTTFGLCKGLRIRDNAIDASGTNGAGGGGIVILSWDASAAFGMPEIARNTITNMAGVTGGVDAFYASAWIHENTIDGVTTSTIDGNGVLIDLGCSNCIVEQNLIRNCSGVAGTVNSGCALMVLAATQVTLRGNVSVNCRNGLHIGAAGGGQSASIYNNTFVNVTDYAIYATATADLANCTVKNNHFDGTGHKVYDNTAVGWTGEDYNNFYGFSSNTFQHTLGANDLALDPQLDSRYLPRNTTLRTAGTYLGGRDYYSKQFQSPPSIGAAQYQPARTEVVARSVEQRSVISRTLKARFNLYGNE